MRKYLLSEEGNFYKSNLHCHTVISDGKNTPEEVKKIYQDMGYSIVAYTDHDIFITHNDLTDDKFLAMNGFEMEVSESVDKRTPFFKCCHICYVALDPNNNIQPMWNERYLFGNAPKYKELVKFDKTLQPYVRKYTTDGVNDMIRGGVEAGFFVTYNHPTWSREEYPEYTSYHGMHAFEMFNGGAMAYGFEDYNPRVYDDILGAGERIYCIGADDNHNDYPGTRKWDSGVAFTVIKAKELSYKAVADSLLAGDFYASEGPEIYALWVEDGKIHIECSDADRIICNFQMRKAGIAYSEGDESINSADFDILANHGYFRLTVVDKKGYHACTNAYYIEEL